MKWILILLLGCTLAETTLGWTYHYSKNIMNWKEARKWCQTRYTDMVAIQSQEENDYLVSWLPDRKSSPYYWIGITKNHINETWTWIGNNSTWVGELSWAANEPNNHFTEFCVEIYVNKGANRGKWNDEKCANRKYAVCYEAQCKETSCVRGRCRETIDNITCLCEPGFKGDRCQTAVECPPLSHLDNGYHSCPKGNLTFNTTCQFKCNLGFLIRGSPDVTCGVSGVWSGPRPYCSSKKLNAPPAVECPPLSHLDNGYHSCPKGNLTFNTTCQLKCNHGFLIRGSPDVTCGVTGVWSGPRPYCASYKEALLAVAGCGAASALCCICLCWMRRRKRKKLTQVRRLEESTSPSIEEQG